MLPIFRVVPVGGVLLAILILLLALTPPGSSHAPLAPAIRAARGPLIDRDEHPEWRQMLIRAAMRRADELSRLRELPDTPVTVAPAAQAESEPPREEKTQAQPEAQPETQTQTPAAEPSPDDPANATRSEPAQPDTAPPVPAVAATEDAAGQLAALAQDAGKPEPAPKDVTGSIEAAPEATLPRAEATPADVATEVAVVLPEEKPEAIHMPAQVKPLPQVRYKRRVRSPVVVEQPTPGLFELMFSTTPTDQFPPATPTPAQSTQKIVQPVIPLYPQLRGDIN